MTQPTTDAREIAARLTKAQREALVDAWPVSGPSESAFIRDVSEDLFDSLEDEALIRWTGTLTPLGLEVRRIIQSEQEGAEP